MFACVILSKIRTYLKHRETVRELSRPAERELDDLDLARFNNLHR